MWRWPGAVFTGFACLQLSLDVKSFLPFVARFWAVLTDLTPRPIHPSWHGIVQVYGKYISRFPLFFQCDGARWLLLTGLSWIPFVFHMICPVAPPSFVMHNSPSSSIVDGFYRC